MSDGVTEDAGSDRCEVCKDESPLPGLSKCLDCTNDALPSGFKLPEDTQERVEERLTEQ